MNRIIILLITLVLGEFCFAGTESYSNRLEGDQLAVVGAGSRNMQLVDPQYFTMESDPNWEYHFSNESVKNYIQLGLKEKQILSSSFSGSMTVEISYHKIGSGSQFLTFTETKTLSVSYSTNGYDLIDDKSTYAFEGAHLIDVRIVSITGLNKEDIYLEAGMFIERYYRFDPSPIPSMNNKVLPDNLLEISWPASPGAESYEIEWVHINDYTLTEGAYKQPSNLSFNYYLNSTRIEIQKNFYRLPLLFDHGYLIYRVRAVGRKSSDSRVDGQWNEAESGKLINHSFSQIVHITSTFDEGMNWAHQVMYTEGGKRMEAISFMDGLGKTHQNVSRNPETNQVIVSNIYYDEKGRAVVSDLPTPIDTEYLKHYPNFNRVKSTNTPYWKDDFYNFNVGACQTTVTGLSDDFGAGKYYSQNNPTTDGANSAISNEGEFAFQSVQYLNDNTGRISKIGTAGKELSLGNKHETEFIYPSPNENELIDLFGIQVGEASHYQRMITIDPNGQVYVQYTDMAGRIVASYMTGQTPQGLDPLTENTNDNGLIEILSPGGSQFVDPSVPSSTVTYSEFIPNDGDYTMNYGFTPEQYQSLCNSSTICFDCVYDLSVRVLDNCGNLLYNYSQAINGGQLDEICNGGFSGLSHTFSNLRQGEYLFEKRLTINKESMEEYLCLFLEDNTCITSYSDEFDAIYNTLNFERCDEKFESVETLSRCEMQRERLLRDFAPGGQYAKANSSDPMSIFNPSNVAGLDYLFAPSVTLIDKDGVDRKDEIQNNPKLYGYYFQPSWVEGFLESHPEYCLLEFCNLIQPSYDYDEIIRNIDDNHFIHHTNAYKYMAPVGDITPTDLTHWYYDDEIPLPFYEKDPFFTSIPEGMAYQADIIQLMNEFITLDKYDQNGNVIGTATYSIWEYAQYLVYDGCISNGPKDDCIDQTDQCYTPDLIWTTFRELYLEAKQQFVNQAYEDYGQVNCPDTRCIGVNTQTSGCTGLKGVEFSKKIAHFGNSLIFEDYQNPSFNDLQSDFQASNLIMCQEQCEDFADEWLETLDGCNFSGVNLTNLRNDLIAVCMTGCTYDDPNSPMAGFGASGIGAITTPPGVPSANGHSSVDEVLMQHFGMSYQSDLCSDLLISTPGEYKSFNETVGEVSTPLDTCGCNIIESSVDRFVEDFNAGTLPTGATYETYFFEDTGIDLDDVNNLHCACSKAKTNPNGWSQDDLQALALMNLSIPANLSCSSNDGCIECSDIRVAVDNLLLKFDPNGNFTFSQFEQFDNFEVILTNYLNRIFDFEMSFTDYFAFYSGCLDDGTIYCQPTPESKEWAKMMNLSAHLGNIYNGANNIDLLTQNVVYQFGSLQNTTLSRFYNISVSGKNVTLDYTNTNGQNCDVKFTLPNDFPGELSDIVAFGDIYANQNPNCNDIFGFTLEAQYYDCGSLKTMYLDGTSSCFKIENCECGDQGQTLCYNPFEDIDNNCVEDQLDILYQITKENYEAKLEALKDQFRTDYLGKCSEAFDTEFLNLSGPFNSYHYTLFYYDQAGNLVRTVAPKGVDNAHGAGFRDNVKAARTNFPANPTSTDVVPTHEYQTNYKYNTYNQLIETTNPDQEGPTTFYYDRYGRIVLSQNPVQRDLQTFSYSIYDPQGRPEQVGLVVSGIPPTAIILEAQDRGQSFRNWVSTKPRSEVTLTRYDRPVNVIGVNPSQKFANGKQENLRLRVASVFYYPIYTSSNNLVTTNYESATHYSYDIHGNVKETIQDVPELAIVNQNTKSTQYEYELISGNVTAIHYQKEKADAFTHEYKYDNINRLTEVFTSKDGVHKSRQARYRYYDHGPVSRVEIGEYKVQGMDYAYTINGWMKGMNSSVLESDNDIGKDGTNGYLSANSAVHSLVAKDALAYTLGYFKGDFSSIASPNFEASYIQGGSENSFSASSNDLYNGNIRSITLSIEGLSTIGKSYRYDQLNRLVNMRAYFSPNIQSTNSWINGSVSDEYFNRYEYDRNGNIEFLLRNGNSTHLAMDQLSYNYNTNFNSQPWNRLDFVSDAASDHGGYEDIKTGMNSGNYTYDKLGQLTGDASEGILNINWRLADKKIKSMTRIDASSPNLEFKYNPMGQRILKIEKPRPSGVQALPEDWIYTFYAYDAGGKLMGVYDLQVDPTNVNNPGKAILDELHIYGASRHGMRKDGTILFDGANPLPVETEIKQNILGKTYYELTNYLGNVNAVISDRKLPDFNVVSGGLSYDGINDHTYTINSLLNNLSGQVTLGAWVKTQQNPQEACLVKYYNSNTNKTVSLVLKNGKVHFVGLTGSNTPHVTPAPGNTINDGNWHYVVATADPNTWKVFVDGILVASMPHPGGNFAGVGNYRFWTGMDPQTNHAHFKGRLKNVEFWKRALTQQEIVQHMNGTINTADADLNGYYPMPNISGGNTFDQSVYGRHMYLVNNLRPISENELNFYSSVLIKNADYYPFGMVMPGRSNDYAPESGYRFAFNGMEQDNEVSGNGNSYTTEFRQYDPRLGRWKSLDPLMHMFPSMSPYCAFDNNPIYYTDIYGLSSEGGGDPPIKMSGTRYFTDKTADKNEMALLPDNPSPGDVTVFEYTNTDGSKMYSTWTYQESHNGEGTPTVGRWEGGVGKNSPRYNQAKYVSLEEVDNVKLLAKAEPPAPELNNGGLDADPPKSEAGTEVKDMDTGIKKKPTVENDSGHDDETEIEESSPTPVNINNTLNATFVRGTSTLKNPHQVRSDLQPIADILINNPNTFIILRGSTKVDGDDGWETMTLYGVTAGQLATNRNYRVRRMLVDDMGVPEGQIRKGQLGSPKAGMKIGVRVMGTLTP